MTGDLIAAPLGLGHEDHLATAAAWLGFRPSRSKRAAVNAYASQVKGLGRLLSDAFRPEGYWTLEVRG